MCETDQLRGVVRRMQIIAAALIAGVVIFLVIVLGLVHGGGQGAFIQAVGRMPVVTIVCVGLALSQVVMALLLPPLLLRGATQRLRTGQIADPTPMLAVLRALNSALIVRLALLEGGAIASAIAYLLEGSTWAWPGILLPSLLMVAYFPTRNSFQEHLEQVARDLQDIAGQ